MTLLHLGCADDIRPGFDNLDLKIDGWTFESGLPYPQESVHGITISHALMYVNVADYEWVFSEFHRVLVPSGVVRITEDDTEDPASARYGVVYPGAKIMTGPRMMAHFLSKAGLSVVHVNASQTCFQGNSLLIAHREQKVPRYVFYIEGVK